MSDRSAFGATMEQLLGELASLESRSSGLGAALATKAVGWGERRLRRSNEQARERAETIAALASLEMRERSLSAELASLRAAETQQQSELRDLRELTRQRNIETNSLDRASKRLRLALESLESA